MLIVAVFLAGQRPALPDGSGDPAAVKNDGGKYFDKNGTPTFNIAPDGTVDWHTYSGYRRLNSECEVCHGPDGEGSSFAPSLTLEEPEPGEEPMTVDAGPSPGEVAAEIIRLLSATAFLHRINP